MDTELLSGIVGLIIGGGVIGIAAARARKVAQDLADDNGLTMGQGDMLMDMVEKGLKLAADAVEDKSQELHDILEQAAKGWADPVDGTDDVAEANAKLTALVGDKE